MAIPTTTVVGLKCPNCGLTDVYPISVFFFNTHQSIAITCNCGTNLLSLSAKEHKRFCLQVQCPFCAQPHRFLLNRNQIWTRKATPLYCQSSGQEIGRLGPNPQPSLISDRHLAESPANRHCHQGAMAPTVSESSLALALSETVDRISLLAEDREIHCHCKQPDLEVEIFSDRIQLHCGSCGAWRIVSVSADGETKGLPDQGRLRLHKVNSGSSQAGINGRSTPRRNKRNI